MSAVIQELSKRFGRTEAVRSVSLHVRDHEFMVLLGPSGSGKTTTLRCVAGLEQPTEGEIFVDDTCLYSPNQGIDVPPRLRNVGFVFQNYALYPHMSVFQNVAFPLRSRGLEATDIQKRVQEVLSLLDLGGHEERKPAQLSGGEQQRVAVARVLVTKPRILLFDEPLSHLDVPLRAGLRAELKRAHRQAGATSIYVTHDQLEAMMMADRIAVMHNGVIQQVGKPLDIYSFPETVFVAKFTGNPKTNLIRGTIRQVDSEVQLLPESDPRLRLTVGDECRSFQGQEVIVNVRPEDVATAPNPSTPQTTLRLYAVLDQGSETLIVTRFGDGRSEIVAKDRTMNRGRYRIGQELEIRFVRGTVYSTETERIVGSFGFRTAAELSPAVRLPS